MYKTLLLSLLVFVSVSVFGQKIEFTYNISEPTVVNIDDYQILELPNSKQLSKQGDPSLPFLSVQLLLPPATKATNIKYVFENKTKLNGNFKLFPKQYVSPISIGSSGDFVVNNTTYQKSSFPEVAFSEVSTQFMNGYGFALSTFSPIEYNPSTDEVYYFKTVKVVVEYQTDNFAAKSLRNISSRSQVVQRVSDFAQNPNIINKYPSKKVSSSYDMLIITSSAYENNFDDLIDFHLYRGIDARVVTLSQIESEMTGVDVPEKMRNYIIQEYQTNDIQYVLLGGDADVVPYRGFYCGVESSSFYEDNDIPADVYFSSLDGTWNDDGDNSWGEPDEDDLFPEIAVGRFPFSNQTELSSIINKVISYSNNPVTSTNELANPLLAGEHLYDGPETWGADYLDLLIGFHDDNGYITTGIPAMSDYTTMYQRDGNNWGGSEIMAAMNDGHSMLHHVGHANSDFMMGLYTSDITNLNFSSLNGVTHNYALVYSHGCICGAFDANDCVSERMVAIDNCAVAVFTNSRYGWFNEGQTEGPSEHLHREFVDAIYTDKQNHAGIAELISKYQTAPWVNNPNEWEPGAQRWVFYDHNVMTDPALPIWTTNPFDINTSYDYILPFGSDYLATVTSAKGPLENYTCAVIQNSQIVGKGYTNASGQALIQVDFDEAVLGDAILIVSGYNILPHQYDISIQEATGAVLSMFSADFIDDNNNLPDFNETLFLDLNIKNYGQQNATNVVLNLSCSDENISILNSTDNIGNIAALDSAISTNLQFETDFVEDQYFVELSLSIISDEFTTARLIPVIINAPKISYSFVNITETSGDGDGILEPGETGNITFNFANSGHAMSQNITGLLSSNDPNISIVTTNQNIGQIDADNDFIIGSEIQISSAAQIGDMITLTCVAQNAPYTKAVEISFYLGDATEDFETGDFTKFDWQFDGDANWLTTTTTVNQGAYSAVSDDIDDSETTSLIIELDILNSGSVSFYKKVSSESGWDYLRFFIDGVEQGNWSGEVDWSFESFDIINGQHVFEWKYSKDGSVSNGNDCAWIDDIVFPPFGSTHIVTQQQTVATNNVNLNVYPVPFNNVVNFAFDCSKSQSYRVEIYDVSGRHIFSNSSIAQANDNVFVWNVPADLQNGIYIYRFFVDNQMFSGKIIKK